MYNVLLHVKPSLNERSFNGFFIPIQSMILTRLEQRKIYGILYNLYKKYAAICSVGSPTCLWKGGF